VGECASLTTIVATRGCPATMVQTGAADARLHGDGRQPPAGRRRRRRAITRGGAPSAGRGYPRAEDAHEGQAQRRRDGVGRVHHGETPNLFSVALSCRRARCSASCCCNSSPTMMRPAARSLKYQAILMTFDDICRALFTVNLSPSCRPSASTFVPPFVGPAGTGGRGKTKGANIVGVFLTLRDVDDAAGSYCLDQFGQAIEDPPDTFEVPGPSAIINRAPLPEVLRLISHEQARRCVVQNSKIDLLMPASGQEFA
jgi:hypothetical protein